MIGKEVFRSEIVDKQVAESGIEIHGAGPIFEMGSGLSAPRHDRIKAPAPFLSKSPTA